MLILLFKKNGKPLVYFRRYKDHRMNRQKAHKMEDVIAITLFAVICCAESWYEVEDFGKKKQAWLSSFLELLADTKGLEECVLANGWVRLQMLRQNV